VEGDDFNEPICDAARSILDGHIILSRRLAASGHYPAIDVLPSVSRLESQLCAPEHRTASRKLRGALATYEESKDLIELGAYAPGTNPALDAAVRAQPEIAAFLKQDTQVDAPFADSLTRMKAIVERL
jgi:flagellar biosynthesis/type III secretory pathway ATPase